MTVLGALDALETFGGRPVDGDFVGELFAVILIFEYDGDFVGVGLPPERRRRVFIGLESSGARADDAMNRSRVGFASGCYTR